MIATLAAASVLLAVQIRRMLATLDAVQKKVCAMRDQ